MSSFRKVLEVNGQPEYIPEGTAFAWDISQTPPRVWYYNAGGIITEWTTGLTNPLSADLAAGSNKITGLATGTSANDAVNKAQMDAAITAGATGITQGSWTGAANGAGMTGTVKSALQSTGRVILYGSYSFTSWGAGANCCILTLADRPSGNRMVNAVLVDSLFTTASAMPVLIDSTGNVKNLSGGAISSASYVFFDGVSFQQDQP